MFAAMLGREPGAARRRATCAACLKQRATISPANKRDALGWRNEGNKTPRAMLAMKGSDWHLLKTNGRYLKRGALLSQCCAAQLHNDRGGAGQGVSSPDVDAFFVHDIDQAEAIKRR